MSDARIGARTIRMSIAAGLAVGILLLGLRSSEASEASPVPQRLLPLFADLEAQFHLAYDASPPAYRSRIQYTLAVMEAWQASGRTLRDEALLAGWVHDAMERSLPGRRAPLAPIPEFSEPRHAAAANSESGGVREHRREQDPEALLPPKPDREAAVPPARPAEVLDSPPVIAPRPEPMRTSPPARRHTVPPIPAEPSPVIAEAAPAIDEPAAPARVVERPTAESATVASMPIQSPAMDPRLPPSPSAAPLPLATKHAPPEHMRIASGEPVEELTQAIGSLNLSEYAARLVGHRMGVRRLEARMLELEAPTLEQLARFVGELEALHNQGSLLAMYTEILPGDMRGTYGPPVSAAETAAMLYHLIQSRQRILSDEPPVAPAAGRDREAALLNTLAEKVTRIVESVKPGG